MPKYSRPQPHPSGDSQAGYSLIELMISVAILTIVSGTVMSGVFQLTRVTDTVSNRSEMHSGVRNATEFLQQEIGQAGRIGFSGGKTLSSAIAVPGAAVVTISPNTTSLFVGEKVIIGTGSAQETATLTAVNSSTQVTATFAAAHAVGAPITVQGGFGSGVVPTTMTDGSTGALLKIYGDVRGDGRMQYIEYSCDTAQHNLYRRAVEVSDTVKPAWSVSHVLLNNIDVNPDGTPCFTYQEKTISGQTYVVNVAITLTVLTQDRDPITGVFQKETKALLNVAPRNVYHVWQLASQDVTSRLQPMPPSVSTLLP